MYLKHFQLIMEDSARDKTYHSHFAFHTFVIRYYLSTQLRKLKFETDGTFDAINIVVGTVKPPYVEIPWYKALNIYIPFNFDLYDNADEAERYRYYVEWIKKGLEIAYEYKNIPYEELMDWIRSLAENKFIYSWDFKSITVREYNLKIRFVCYLSKNDFTIRMSAFDRKRSVCICEGQIIRTMPDSIFFGFITKKIKIRDGKIVIPNTWGEELMHIELKDLVNGKITAIFPPNPFTEEDEISKRYFDKMQKNLKYNNNDFV